MGRLPSPLVSRCLACEWRRSVRPAGSSRSHPALPFGRSGRSKTSCRIRSHGLLPHPSDDETVLRARMSLQVVLVCWACPARTACAQLPQNSALVGRITDEAGASRRRARRCVRRQVAHHGHYDGDHVHRRVPCRCFASGPLRAWRERGRLPADLPRRCGAARGDDVHDRLSADRETPGRNSSMSFPPPAGGREHVSHVHALRQPVAPDTPLAERSTM